MAESVRDELREQIDVIERGYEFFLAYAAQGYEDEKGSRHGGELRDQLGRLTGAAEAIPDLLARVGEGEEGVPGREELRRFEEVVRGDAERAAAALRLVAAQPSLSSQLVDNLNASVHLRALLTDLFLVDEVLKPASGAGEANGDAAEGTGEA